MILIVCLDENNGMMFNNRRQSKDCELRKRLISVIGNAPLWMSEYSRGQFEEPFNYCDDVNKAKYFFVENINDLSSLEFEQVIVYRWNRKYPGDMFFDLSNRKLISTFDFAGKSHEKITEEVYQ